MEGCDGQRPVRTLTAADAAKAKYWATELQGRVIQRIYGAQCYAMEPDLFPIDDDGYSTLQEYIVTAGDDHP